MASMTKASASSAVRERPSGVGSQAGGWITADVADHELAAFGVAQGVGEDGARPRHVPLGQPGVGLDLQEPVYVFGREVPELVTPQTGDQVPVDGGPVVLDG